MDLINHKPFFTVILPVFNRAVVVAEAIQSVLDQTYQKWELIIINDYSTDSTEEVISIFKDPRIKKINNIGNHGPAFSRNRGIELASGELISFLDSDDRFFPEFLQRTFDFFQSAKSKIGFCWTGLEVKYSNGIKREVWSPDIKESAYYTFLKELRIGTNSGLTIAKEVFQECGLFNESLPAAEDTELLLRIAQTYNFGVISEVLISIDKSGKDRLSLKYQKIAVAYNQFIHLHWQTITLFPELKKKYYYKLMWLNYHLGNYKLARQYFHFLRNEFGVFNKVLVVKLLFEIFGKRIGSKIHIFLSY